MVPVLNLENKVPKKIDENKKEQIKQNSKKNTLSIKSINIQGLTKVKVPEIEELIENECDLIVLTETQLKMDKIAYNKNVASINSMRHKKDKKGGGLTILHKIDKDNKLDIQTSENNDILDVRGKIQNTKIRIISVYLSIESSNDDDKIRNINLKREIVNKIEQSDAEEALIILGDFNGHTGFLGHQKLDNNGQFIIELMDKHSLILLNNDPNCKGLYTWSRKDQKSVIDYILVNKTMYDRFLDMNIDENKEILDISDHHLMTAKFRITNTRTTNGKSNKWEEREYYKLDKTLLQNYAEEVEQKFQTNRIQTISEANEIIKEMADKHLKRKYRRRITNEEQKISEPPWMNENIKREIKKRKELNRAKRNEKNEEKKQELWSRYLEQKKIVQIIIKEEIYKNEEKITDEIRKEYKHEQELV